MIDHSRKMALFEYPALRNIGALTAASGIPPRNMPTRSVYDRVLKLTN
jgi:hypothetical protein